MKDRFYLKLRLFPKVFNVEIFNFFFRSVIKLSTIWSLLLVVWTCFLCAKDFKLYITNIKWSFNLSSYLAPSLITNFTLSFLYMIWSGLWYEFHMYCIIFICINLIFSYSLYSINWTAMADHFRDFWRSLFWCQSFSVLEDFLIQCQEISLQ